MQIYSNLIQLPILQQHYYSFYSYRTPKVFSICIDVWPSPTYFDFKHFLKKYFDPQTQLSYAFVNPPKKKHIKNSIDPNMPAPDLYSHKLKARIEILVPPNDFGFYSRILTVMFRIFQQKLELRIRIAFHRKF